MNSLLHKGSVIGLQEECYYYNTVTTSEAYNKQLEDLAENDSITLQYGNNLESKISQLQLLAFEISKEQLETLLQFIYALIKLEETYDLEFEGIEMTSSLENEIIFFRKSLLGISMISVDHDGDLLFNFTGFKSGFDTKRFSFGDNIDFEQLIYHFFSR